MKEKYRHPEPSSKGLIAHYKLWAGLQTAGTIFDYSLNGNTGTVKANSAPAYPGFSFDGVGDYITIGNAGSTLEDNFTISILFNLTSVNTRLMSRRPANDTTQWDTYLELPNGVLVIYDGGTEWKGTTTGLNDNKWHQADFVINGASSMIYLDGIADRAAFNPSITAQVETTTIGCYRSASPAAFSTGTIGEIMLFDIALSAPEVKSLYETRRWRYSI